MMSSIMLSMVITVVLLIMSIGTGYFVSSLGRPLNTPVFTFHKLTALGAIVLSIWMMISQRMILFQSSPVDLILIVSGACLFILFFTGSLLSFERSWPAVIRIIHRIFPWITLSVVTAGIFWVLKNKTSL